jgi:plasmid stabilization system protein ParE
MDSGVRTLAEQVLRRFRRRFLVAGAAVPLGFIALGAPLAALPAVVAPFWLLTWALYRWHPDKNLRLARQILREGAVHYGDAEALSQTDAAILLMAESVVERGSLGASEGETVRALARHLNRLRTELAAVSTVPEVGRPASAALRTQLEDVEGRLGRLYAAAVEKDVNRIRQVVSEVQDIEFRFRADTELTKLLEDE